MSEEASPWVVFLIIRGSAPQSCHTQVSASDTQTPHLRRGTELVAVKALAGLVCGSKWPAALNLSLIST